MNYRFHIKNSKGRFALQIAMDWGRRGGCSAADFIDIAKTAFPKLTGQTQWHFEFEPQAQTALNEFKAWLKKRNDEWCAARRISYEQNNPFIQTYKKACAESKTH